MRFYFNSEPEEGQERVIKQFTWLPVRIGDELRWLEHVSIRQSYDFGRWVNYEFVNS